MAKIPKIVRERCWQVTLKSRGDSRISLLWKLLHVSERNVSATCQSTAIVTRYVLNPFVTRPPSKYAFLYFPATDQVFCTSEADELAAAIQKLHDMRDDYEEPVWMESLYLVVASPIERLGANERMTSYETRDDLIIVRSENFFGEKTEYQVRNNEVTVVTEDAE